MPFALNEYGEAFGIFVGDVVRELARSRDPVLREMTFEAVPSTVGSRVQSRDGLNVELEPSSVGFEITLTDEEIRDFDISALVFQLDQAADEYAKGLMKMWVETMGKVTEATGNVVDAGGELTFETFYEMLEKMEWPDVDDEGNQVLPSIVAHPNTVERLTSLPDLTPEQQARMDALKKRKHEESLARRRSRRLS